jgi:hypothetical protein
MDTKLLLYGSVAVLFLTMSSWTPVVIVSTHEDNINYRNKDPEIAVDPAGNSYIVWEGHDGKTGEIYWVKINPQGIPGMVKEISTSPKSEFYDDKNPQIAVDPAGNSYVVWYSTDYDVFDAYWVKIDPQSVPGTVKEILTPSETESASWNPQIAVDPAGNSYIVWEGHDGDNKDIYWVKIDSHGAFGHIHKISTHPDNINYGEINPQIIVDSSGNSYVIWQGCTKENCWKEPGNMEIYWTKIDPQGIPGMVKKVPPTSPDNIDTLSMVPQIAVDTAGNSYIVWSGKNKESYDIYWVKINTEGNLGIVQRISAYLNSDFNDVHPEIDVDALKNLYITWEGSTEDNSGIYWVKINSSNIPGAVQKVSKYLFNTENEDWDAQIAVDPAGNSYIAWCSFNRKPAEQFDQQIYWVKIDTEENQGKIFKISSPRYFRHYDRNPRICVDSEGNTSVTWVGQDTSKHEHIFFTACTSDSTSITIVIVVVIALMAIAAASIIIIKRRKKNIQIQENKY